MQVRSGGSWSRRVVAAALGAAALAVLAPVGATAEEDCGVTLIVCADPGPAPEPAPTTTTTSTTTTVPTAPAQPTTAEAAARLLELANEERAAAGVAPLTARADVAEIAQSWSAAMADAGALSHNDAYFSAETRERLDAALRGENVAYAGGIEQAHRALMDSPPHRANLLDGRFSVVGMGAVLVDGTWWVTQDFLQPRTTRPAAAPGASGPLERARALPADDGADAAGATVRSTAAAGAPDVAVLAATPPAPASDTAEGDRPTASSRRSVAAAGATSNALLVPLALVALALAAVAAVAMLLTA